MEIFTFILILLCGGAAGLSAYLFVQNKSLKENTTSNLSEIEAIEKASDIAKKKLQESEEKANRIHREAQSLADKTRAKLRNQEKDLNQKEERLASKYNEIDKKLDEIDAKSEELENLKSQIKTEQEGIKKKIEEIASLTEHEARELLKTNLKDELKVWISKEVKEAEEEIERKKKEKSQEILSQALLNASVEFTSETTTTVVDIGDESMKGRIIGKEGRNIRTFQDRTGVDLIMDESPTQVTISSFDPIRREVGALALKRLIKEGKIHPASIEETISRVKKNLSKEIRKTGEEFAYEAGINTLHPEIISLLGRYKYRYSQGQNLIKHSLEVVKIAEALAKEFGVNVEKVKIAALLHDIGKVSPEEGKMYYDISAEIVDKYIKDRTVIDAIRSLIPENSIETIEGEIIKIADLISTSRPGAQEFSYESHIKRLRAVEDIAMKQAGVKQAYALKAGKELKVIVEPSKVKSSETKALAFEIAKEIENSQIYTGSVRVTVVREYRTQAVAN